MIPGCQSSILLRRWLGCALVCTVGVARTAETDSVPVTGPTFELPPLVVTGEDPTLPPWKYVAGPGFELLSRCEARLTEDYADSYYRGLQYFQILVPPNLQPEMSAPSIQLLYPEDLVRLLPAELEAALKTLTPTGVEGPATARIVPSMGLADHDLWTTHTVIESAGKTITFLKLTPNAVRQRLEARTPSLPAWFTEGVLLLYRDARFEPGGLRLAELDWVTEEETKALRKYRGHPRSLLPLSVLFRESAVGLNPPDDTLAHPWRHQAALFIRWAFDDRKLARRAALFKFVAKASEAPVTETMFKECFGLGYADVQDRLSDYLSKAVQSKLLIKPTTMLASLRMPVRLAEPSEIARIKGDWERLAVNYIRAAYPALVPTYLKQARKTLFNHYDAGDPGLNAAIALSFVDADEGQLARTYLELAVQTAVKRPRPYYELSALRLQDHLPSAGGVIAAEQVEFILEPLRQARALSPHWPATYLLLAQVLSVADRPATAGELTWLAESRRLFPRDERLAFLTARLHVLHGTKAEAKAFITHGRQIATDDSMRRLFDQLGEALAVRPD